MKDFAAEYLKTETIPPQTDPYLYTTPEVREELLEMQGMSFSTISLAQILAVLATAPLTTITASLQLSVKPHKQIFQETPSKSTQITKINTALTLQQKRKMELMLRAGGQQRPYTAPVYEGYQAVLKGLASQGWKAYFKGLFFRSVHQLARSYAFYQIGLSQSNQSGYSELETINFQIGKLWLLQCLCDISLNVFHIAENRYILQNNIPEFRVFRNGHKVIRKMYARKEALTAISYHFVNTFIEVFGRLPFYISLISAVNPMSLAVLYFSELVIYPLNTAFRRLTCQSQTIPSMIPVRYSGLWHALRLITSEQGLIGLYRGFGLHHLTMGVRLASLSLLAPMLVKKISQE